MSGSNGLNGKGGHTSEPAGEPTALGEGELSPLLLEPEEVAAAPSEVAELAASCVRFVASKYKVHLDFQPETLSLVDQYLRDARADIAARPEAADLIAAAAGVYLGEVIRLRFGGYWRVTGDHSSWRVLLSRVYLAFNPIGMARESLFSRDEEGWHAHFETDPGEREIVERRLAVMPEVEEEEYFAPSTRFDVVQVAVEAIRAHMQDSGTSDVRFSPEDYV